MGLFKLLFNKLVGEAEEEPEEELTEEMEEERDELFAEHLLKFPYLDTLHGVFSYSAVPKLCECCDEETQIYSELGIYSEDEVDILCPDCIQGGVAAVSYEGEFNEIDRDAVSEEDADAILHRTPTLPTNQEFSWKVCCGKPCIYLKRATHKDAEELNLFEELQEEIAFEDLEELLGEDEDSSLVMLFRCKECGKIHAIVDLD